MWKIFSTVTLLQEPNRVPQDRHCLFKYNSEVCSCNHFCHEKPNSITYSECVSVAVIVHKAKWMHHIILSCVEYLAVPNLSTLSHKWQDFQKKVDEWMNEFIYLFMSIWLCGDIRLERKICVLIFSTTFVWNNDQNKVIVRVKSANNAWWVTLLSHERLIMILCFIHLLHLLWH